MNSTRAHIFFLGIITLAFSLSCQLLQGCNQQDTALPDAAFSLGGQVYTAQQIIDGEAPQVMDARLMRRIESLTKLGLTLSMFEPGGITSNWGEPGLINSDASGSSEVSGVYGYFLEARPSSNDPIDLVMVPHVFVYFYKGKLNNLSAKAGNDMAATERFVLGNLRLLGSTKEQYEKLLGKPTTTLLQVPERKAVIVRWDLIVGNSPNMVLLLQEATFENDVCVSTLIDVGYEVPNPSSSP